MNPEKLASLVLGNCKKSEKEITKTLRSNGSKDLLFALTHKYQLYQLFQKKIKSRLKAILIMLSTMVIDLDHLLADPIYDPDLLQYYVMMPLFPRTRVVDLGLVIHIILDFLDCWY